MPQELIDRIANASLTFGILSEGGISVIVGVPCSIRRAFLIAVIVFVALIAMEAHARYVVKVTTKRRDI